MTRFLALAAMLAGCSSGAESASLEAPMSDTVASPPIDIADSGVPPESWPAPPHVPDAPLAPTTTVLLSPPPPPAPPTGFHEADSGACYLPDLLNAGRCVCKVGALCPGGCGYLPSGEAYTRAFCFDAGLPYDYRPR